ncbi:MAG: hypothetical protein HUN04_01765 [Desulfobacter sp.]|nr:MAG: hypothetical protein HUN04_01765 [Desulfobacter sp.]
MKKRRRRQRVVIDFCAECGALLSPCSHLCQFCGCDNRWDAGGEMEDISYDEILNDPDFETWHSA